MQSNEALCGLFNVHLHKDRELARCMMFPEHHLHVLNLMNLVLLVVDSLEMQISFFNEAVKSYCILLQDFLKCCLKMPIFCTKLYLNISKVQPGLFEFSVAVKNFGCK